jgi:hypothetical protein
MRASTRGEVGTEDELADARAILEVLIQCLWMYADGVADADAGQRAPCDQVVHVASADIEAFGDIADLEKAVIHVIAPRIVRVRHGSIV